MKARGLADRDRGAAPIVSQPGRVTVGAAVPSARAAVPVSRYWPTALAAVVNTGR